LTASLNPCVLRIDTNKITENIIDALDESASSANLSYEAFSVLCNLPPHGVKKICDLFLELQSKHLVNELNRKGKAAKFLRAICTPWTEFWVPPEGEIKDYKYLTMWLVMNDTFTLKTVDIGWTQVLPGKLQEIIQALCGMLDGNE